MKRIVGALALVVAFVVAPATAADAGSARGVHKPAVSAPVRTFTPLPPSTRAIDWD